MELKRQLFTSLTLATLLASSNIVLATDRQVIQDNVRNKNISNESFTNLTVREDNGGAIYNSGQISKIENSSFINNSAISKNGFEIKLNDGYSYDTETKTLKKDGEIIDAYIEGLEVDDDTIEEWDIGYTKEIIEEDGSSTYKYISIGTAHKVGGGGAIYSSKDSSIELISNSNFENNTATTHGGAIYNNGNYLKIKNSTFKNNKIEGTNDNVFGLASGGAIHNMNGDLVIENSEFSNNIAYKKNSVTYDNHYHTRHDAIGGAIYTDGNTTIKDSTFTGNKASSGGAIYADWDSLDNDNQNTVTLTIENSKFKNNEATYIDTQRETIDGETYEHTWIDEGEFNPDTQRYYILDNYNGEGGAISTWNKQTLIKNSEFEGNKSSYGGAISSCTDSLEISDSTFKNNNAKWNLKGTYYDRTNDRKLELDQIQGAGGAIQSYDENLKINHSTFENNSSGLDGGGAIYLNSKVANIDNSTFNTNNTLGNGGAISTENYNNSVNINNSTFKTNKSENEGGAAYISTKNLSINNTLFDSNSAEYEGGAIQIKQSYSNNEKEDTDTNKISITDSTFNNNAVNFKNGQIEIGKEIIEAFKDIDINPFSPDIELDNLEKITQQTNPYGFGGAISTNEDTNINNSKFINNKAVYGGAIATSKNLTVTNSQFEGNKAHGTNKIIATYKDSEGNTTNKTYNEMKDGRGGAIYTTGNTTIVDTNFANNTSDKGGAIYVSGYTSSEDTTSIATNIIAKDKDITFSGNKANKGSDIYIDNGTVNLNAAEGKKITFDGGISGVNSTININTKDLYDDINSTGTVVVNNFITPDLEYVSPDSNKKSSINVNVNVGNLKLTRDNYLNGVDLTLADSSTLDMMNSEIGNAELNSLTSNNGNIKLDVDFGNTEQIFDFIDTNADSQGSLNITGISVLSDMPDNMINPIVIDINKDLDIAESLQIKTQDEGVNSATNEYLYTTIADGKNITITRLSDNNGNAIQIDGFTLAVNKEGNINGSQVSLSDERVFTANKDINITGKNITEGWTGELGGKELTVIGRGYTLQGNQNQGINISDEQKLSFVDTNITGFKTNNERKGALNVNNGTLEVVARNKDVTLDGTTADKKENTNIVYLDGTSSKAYFITENKKSITINDPMRSSNKSNEIYLKGNGKITVNEIGDPVILYNENENTVHNNYIDGVVYNLNSGKVHFTNDTYLNGVKNKNSIYFNGGTLDIANGEVNTIHLNSLNINSNSNVMVDVDLANKKMDRLTADNYNLENKNLNVSKLNLLSDAKETTTNILFADDKLKNNVTTTVEEVAYSPIYKYGVGYNKTSGQFTFTRGAGSDINTFNPAVLASPVAAQMGGYMGMLDNYSNAFSHMDMNMLKPASIRMAEMNANKYAISDQPQSYYSNEMNSSGAWFKPYVSYDSVRLKHGPKVNNMSYGSFIGGDTGVKSFRNGFSGVLTPYIAYQGSHQSYSGNSIYQNGGSLGLTGTLYKGNFFTGLTVGVGANVAESNTMYGHDDFGMFMTGVASKTGYNFEFDDGKFIIQPSVLLSYTMVDTFNYTNSAGVKIHSDALNALQISPNLKFVMNTKSGWQPYLTAGMNWNIMGTDVTANQTSLPDMYVKPYVQYGVGVQKTVGERLTAFLQVVLRNGGRNGIAGNGGFRYMLGKNKKGKEKV